MGLATLALVAPTHNTLAPKQVTPYELELALVSGREWTGAFTTDFSQVLPGGQLSTREDTLVAPESDDVALGVRYDPVTGRLRDALDADVASSDRRLVTSSDGTVALSGTAAAHMLTRSFKGLDLALNADTPSVIEQGLSGIARKYASEPGSGVVGSEARAKMVYNDEDCAESERAANAARQRKLASAPVKLTEAEVRARMEERKRLDRLLAESDDDDDDTDNDDDDEEEEDQDENGDKSDASHESLDSNDGFMGFL